MGDKKNIRLEKNFQRFEVCCINENKYQSIIFFFEINFFSKNSS